MSAPPSQEAGAIISSQKAQPKRTWKRISLYIRKDTTREFTCWKAQVMNICADSAKRPRPTTKNQSQPLGMIHVSLPEIERPTRMLKIWK